MTCAKIYATLLCKDSRKIKFTFRPFSQRCFTTTTSSTRGPLLSWEKEISPLKSRVPLDWEKTTILLVWCTENLEVERQALLLTWWQTCIRLFIIQMQWLSTVLLALLLLHPVSFKVGKEELCSQINFL